MDTTIQETRLNLRSEAELASEEAQKAEEAKVKAVKEAELAAEAATDVRDFAIKSAIAAREAAQERKIKAREAKLARRAVLNAERKAKMMANLAKKAKEAETKAARRGETRAEAEEEWRVKVEGSRGLAQDPRAKQDETELTKEVESAPKDWTGEKAREHKEKTETKIKAAGEMKPAEESVTAAKEAKEESSQLYEKKINLTLMPPVDALKAKSMEEELRKVQNLRILLTGGSVEGGVKIVVVAEQPIPLADVLGQLPTVEKVAKNGKDLQISLKTRA